MAKYILNNEKILHIRKVTESKEGPKVEVGDNVYTVETRGMRSDEAVVKPETMEILDNLMDRYKDALERLAK